MARFKHGCAGGFNLTDVRPQGTRERLAAPQTNPGFSIEGKSRLSENSTKRPGGDPELALEL